MVTAELIAAAVGVVGLVAGIPGWLARRDTKHKEELEGQIGETEAKVEELDTAFARVTTRLFGHPEDESDAGVLTERGQRVDVAEENIDSLSDDVRYAVEQAEENGQAIQHLDERVSEHSQQTREALIRIEEQLENGVQILPEHEDDEFLRGGGQDAGGD